MRELVCDTSPLQYLHQLRHLDLLSKLADSVVVPPAVVEELAVGKQAGYDVPVPDALQWIQVCEPAAVSAERLVGDLGRGETEVLMLAIERPDAIAVIDDKLARWVAETLHIRFTGTLGILLDAKRSGHVQRVAPLLDRLQELRFRVSPAARVVILRAAGDSPRVVDSPILGLRFSVGSVSSVVDVTTDGLAGDWCLFRREDVFC